MTAAAVIANYQALSALMGQMQEAATRNEWDRLISLEHRCGQLVDAMKPMDASVELDEAARQRKLQLIAQILADDAEIRKHTQAWMGQLQLTMRSNRQEQQLLRTYGA